MHRRLIAIAGLLLALAIAAPVSAATTDRFSFEEQIVDSYTCGVVVTTRVIADGTAHLGADGSWRFTTIRFRYWGQAVQTATGRTIPLTGRQILMERPDQVALIGQGSFIRLAGEGVLLGDVGRLVFDPSDGSTIAASAHVLRFDDPDARARLDAAICSLFD